MFNIFDLNKKLVKNLKLFLLIVDKFFLIIVLLVFLIENVIFILFEYFLFFFLVFIVVLVFWIFDIFNFEVLIIVLDFIKDFNIKFVLGIFLFLGNIILFKFVFLIILFSICCLVLLLVFCGFFCVFLFLLLYLVVNKGIVVNDDVVNKLNNIFLFVFIIIYIFFLKNNFCLYYIKVVFY